MKKYWEMMKELREDRDIKQSTIANYLHTSQQMYSRYETGAVELPLRHLIALCQYYHVSADYILGLSPYPQINDSGTDPRNRPAEHTGKKIP